VAGGLALAAGAYLGALLYRRRWAPGAPLPARKVASFLGGLAVLALALTGPLHELAESHLFSAHMVQHLLLAFAVPPLVLYGTPGWMLRPFLRRPGVARVAYHLTRPPATFAAFNVVLLAWHLPPLYNLAMEVHDLHILQHLTILAVSGLLWWPLLSPLPELPRAPYPIQLLYLFVGGLPMVIASIVITLADTVLYDFYARAPRVWPGLTPLADQHLGGLIMWVPGGLVFLVAISVVFFRWQAAGADDAALPAVETGQDGR
jgi:putative membrane protein